MAVRGSGAVGGVGRLANLVVMVGGRDRGVECLDVARANREREMSNIEKWSSAQQDKGFVAVGVFGGGAGAEVVNSFLKNFRSQELYWLAVAFASVRLGAGGVFDARFGREKKGL